VPNIGYMGFEINQRCGNFCVQIQAISKNCHHEPASAGEVISNRLKAIASSPDKSGSSQ